MAVVTDNFNRANESPMTGNWTSPIGAVAGAEGALRIVSNQVFTTVDEVHSYAIYSGDSFVDDQYGQVEIRTINPWTGVILRADTLVDRFYLGFVFGANDYRILSRWDGVYNTLATGTAVTWSTGDVLKVGIAGSAHPVTITLYRNGVSVLTFTTTSSAQVRTGGKPGMGIYSPPGLNLRLDNWEAGGAVTGSLDNADVVVNFTGGSNGDLASASNLAAGTQNATGITSSWALDRVSQHSFIVNSTALPLLEPVICGGTTYTNTSGRAINYDLTLAASNAASPVWEQHKLQFGTNSVGNVTLGAMVNVNVVVGNDNDMFIIYDRFAVTQYHSFVGEPGPYFNAHAQIASGASTHGNAIRVDQTVPYWISERRNVTDQLAEVVIQNGTTGAFIGCSRSDLSTGTLLSLIIGSYILPVGGTIKHSMLVLAFDAKATLPLLPGAFVLPPPASVVATDNTSNISLSFGDVVANALAFAYRIERTEDGGATWGVIESNLAVPLDNTSVSPYNDTTVAGADNVTFQYGITALLGTWESTPTLSNEITRGTPPEPEGAVVISGAPIF